MDASFRFHIFLKLTKYISKSSYLPANARMKPKIVQITAETSSAGGQGGCSRGSSTPIPHAPSLPTARLSALSQTPTHCVLPSWLPVRLAGEAAGLNTGDLVRIYAAPWVRALDDGNGMLCALLPPDTQQSQSHIWVALFIDTLAGNFI